MKKITLTIIFTTVLISLGACSVNEKNQTKHSDASSNISDIAETLETSDRFKEVSKFSAVLTEDVTENEDSEQTIRLVLGEVKAVEDPQKIINMMETDGVILNIESNQLADGMTKDDLKKGDQVEFILTGMPIMTRSIPPQIPGNSVERVQKIG